MLHRLLWGQTTSPLYPLPCHQATFQVRPRTGSHPCSCCCFPSTAFASSCPQGLLPAPCKWKTTKQKYHHFTFFFFFWRFAKQANVRLHSWARATTEIKQNRPEGRQHVVGTGGKAKASPPGWAERKGWWATTGGLEEQAASGLPAKRKPSTHLPSACCIYLDLGDSDVPCVLWSCCTTRNCHPARSSDPRAADPCLAQGAPCSHHVWGCNTVGKAIK